MSNNFIWIANFNFIPNICDCNEWSLFADHIKAQNVFFFFFWGTKKQKNAYKKKKED